MSAMSAGPLTVLVVDDDYRVASVHVGFVERVEGFRVVGEAHTAAEALSLAEELSPDLVLLDIYLPDGDGLAVAKQLAGRPSPPVILVISAATDVENVRAALRLGVAHYLVKPFAFSALAERLTSVRDLSTQIEGFPEEATQGDVDALFESFRPAKAREIEHLAPTLQLVYRALAASSSGLSAMDVAARVGISRATAQRALSQLEQSDAIALELNYGRTGRPEHRYSARRRSTLRAAPNDR
jgi:response regulator of citrate/malate metabolism